MASLYYNTAQPISRIKYPLGTIVCHKDREGRERPKIQTDRGLVDAPSFLYEYVYFMGRVEPGERVVPIDGNRLNLSADNLRKCNKKK